MLLSTAIFLFISSPLTTGFHHSVRPISKTQSKVTYSLSPLFSPPSPQFSPLFVDPPINDSANQEATDGSADFRQLVGLKGASTTADKSIWAIRLQLTKPVTWIPLVWGVMCGAAASGNYHWIWNPFDPNDRDVLLGFSDAFKVRRVASGERLASHRPTDGLTRSIQSNSIQSNSLPPHSQGLTAMILAGPFLTGFTQTINDWYDRDIDAINEPYRPIPSGAISKGEVVFQIWFLLLGGLGISYGLDGWAGHEFPTVLALSIFGSFISYIYSAPPLKLKQNGWAGNFALGASYISLPWWCGQAVFGTLDKPVYFVLPVLYSIAGLGIAIVNDFKR